MKLEALCANIQRGIFSGTARPLADYGVGNVLEWLKELILKNHENTNLAPTILFDNNS